MRGQDRCYAYKLNASNIREGISNHYNLETHVQDEVFMLPERNNASNAFEVLLSAEVLNENAEENVTRREIRSRIRESRWVIY